MNKNLISITKNSSILFVGKIFDSIFLFVFNLLAFRYIGANDYGIYVYVLVVIMFGAIMVKSGLDQGLSGILPKYNIKEIDRSVISFSIIIIFIISFLVITISYIFAIDISKIILNNENIAKYFIVMLPLIGICAIVQFSEGVFRTIGGIHYFVFAKSIIIPSLLSISLLIQVFIFELSGVAVLFRSTYLGWGGASVYILIILRRMEYLGIPKMKYINIYKTLLLLSSPLIFVGMLDYLIGKVDVFTIGYMLDEISVGVYNIIERISYLSSYFFVAFSSIMAPYITKSYHKDQFNSLKSLYRTITLVIVMINLGVVSMLIISRHEILNIFGSQYILADKMLVIIASAYAINSLGGPVIYMNSMTGQEKKELYISLMMLCSNVIFNYLLVNWLGILGVAYSTLIVFSAGLIVRLVIMNKNLKMTPFSRQYLFSVGISFIVLVIVYGLKKTLHIESAVVSILVFSSVYVVMYLALLASFVVKKEERKHIYTLISAKLK